MKPKFDTLERKLSEIKKNNLLRTLQDGKIEKQYIKINKKKYLIFHLMIILELNQVR
uniref:Uncharacterized protein n=1 Tax=uncultured marine thaumarchaeote KM3_23_F10 TaxID=1456100 RepID=A0A075GVF4_9ARCH|nr:hypothetical protein [uncultured marine thaumarchaeote KM3_23_F10]